MPARPATRRTVLRGAVLAAGAAAIGAGTTACAGGDDTPETPTEPLDLGTADAVPVGGAKLYREQRVVVSRPSDGEYAAFGAVCPHAGCVLTGVEKLEAHCGCHGSRFDTTTGEVLQGPASSALPEVPVRTENGTLIVAPEKPA